MDYMYRPEKEKKLLLGGKIQFDESYICLLVHPQKWININTVPSFDWSLCFTEEISTIFSLLMMTMI